MIVKEMIELLQQFPPDLPVVTLTQVVNGIDKSMITEQVLHFENEERTRFSSEVLDFVKEKQSAVMSPEDRQKLTSMYAKLEAMPKSIDGKSLVIEAFFLKNVKRGLIGSVSLESITKKYPAN